MNVSPSILYGNLQGTDGLKMPKICLSKCCRGRQNNQAEKCMMYLVTMFPRANISHCPYNAHTKCTQNERREMTASTPANSFRITQHSHLVSLLENIMGIIFSPCYRNNENELSDLLTFTSKVLHTAYTSFIENIPWHIFVKFLQFDNRELL